MPRADGLRWVYCGGPADPGRWKSHDGRFAIAPCYEGTTKPQSYQLMDRGKRVDSYDTVSAAKHDAGRIVEGTL